jgi:hypothetical protein
MSVPLLRRLTAVLGCMALAIARPNFTALAASVKSIIILLILRPCLAAIPLASMSAAT